MNAGLGWQYAVIAMLTLVSVLYTVRKVAPRLGKRPGKSAGDCDSGCGSCGGCSTASPPLDEQPLEFHSRRT